jgi:hypothetical protein
VAWSTTAAPAVEAEAAIRLRRQPAVGPALPIVFTILWLLVAAASGLASMFSFFLFDAGADRVSVWTWMIFFGFWGTLLLCPTSILLSWIAWAVTRSRMQTGWGRFLRGTCYALPLVGIVSVLIGFIAGDVLCGGSLTCD